MVSFYAWHLQREESAESMSALKRSMKDIALDVLGDFPGVSLEDIRGPRRMKTLILPRQIAMYRIMTERQDSYPAIGRFFGDRDHTTVLHPVRKIEDMIRGGRI